MKAKDFLCEFQDSHFPQTVGPWIGLDDHDPPWPRTQLKQMQKQDVIEFNQADTHYRLTLKAMKLRAA